MDSTKSLDKGDYDRLIERLSKKRLFSVDEAASYLGLSPRTIYNGIAPKSKKPFPVKPKRFGRKPLFEKADLDCFIENLPS